jgi:hypothetical protein
MTRSIHSIVILFETLGERNPPENDFGSNVRSNRGSQGFFARTRAKMLAKAVTLGKVHHQRLRQEGLGRTVSRPLKLVVAATHVLEQVFHPEKRILSIPHVGQSLREPGNVAIDVRQGLREQRPYLVLPAGKLASTKMTVP